VEVFFFHLIYPDVHELWMRLIVEAILVNFSFYGQNIINQLRRTEAGSDKKRVASS